jgi:hypothetical protein
VFSEILLEGEEEDGRRRVEGRKGGAVEGEG